MMERKILVVDDVKINRIMLREILRNEYDVIEADNGERALAILLRQYKTISAVMLDIVMPVMDGYEVLLQMRANEALAQIPVIVVTGNAEEAAEVRAITLGANDFITKPYNPELVRHCLRNAINLYETASIVYTLQRDKLTGLYNREAFFEQANKLIAAHPCGYYVMTCFDIDNFKVVNDQYGTDRGDEVLRHVAGCIDRCMTAVGGICCRVMADCFALLYPRSVIETGRLEENQHEAMNPPCLDRALSIRIGRYMVNDLSLSASAMYDRAALAENTVKGKYGVRVAVYDESMREHIIREQQIVTEMNDALRAGQLEPWFQPQYNHATGARVGAEALVRWRHPTRGLVPPNEFVPVFERNGFIYEMDKYIWEQVCAYLRKWMDEGRSPLPVSVNISRHDLFREDCFDTLAGLVERYGVPVELLRLEVTESAFVSSTDQIVTVVKRLIDHGFTVEIDDFGSGYSSLNTLKDVPAIILKLDMKFLDSTGESQRSGNILESVVRMAKWLGMSVIAEGVETVRQADYLKSIGCYYIQGYLYAKPMPPQEYEALSPGGAESRMRTLETVEKLDNNAFWNPESMDTLIFNSYVGGACIVEYHDGEAELLRVNDRFAQEIGVPFSVGEPASVLAPEHYLDGENLGIMRSCFLNAIQQREENACEVCMLDANGGRVWLRFTIRMIASVSNRYLLYCAVFNMTGQRAAEEKARETADRLLTLMSDIPGGFCRMKAAHERHTLEIVFVNEGFCRLAGMTHREVMNAYGTDALAGLHPDDRRKVMETYARLPEDGGSFSANFRLRHGGGGYVHVMVFGRLTVAETGEKYVNSYYTDISEQMRQEEQRKELLDNLPVGATLFEYAGGRLTAVNINKRYQELVGRTIADPSGVTVADFVHPDDRARMLEELSAAVLQGRDAVCDLRIRYGDGGEYRAFHTVSRSVKRGKGKYAVYTAYAPILESGLALQDTLPHILSAVMESSADYIFAKDRQHRYICASKAFVKAFAKTVMGLENERDVIGKTDRELVGGELASLYEEADARVMNEGKPLLDATESLTMEDGTLRYIKTSKYPLRDREGNVIGLYGTSRDVTRYKDAYERLRLLADTIPGGLAMYEASPRHMRALYFNDGYFRLTGYTREEYEKMAKKDSMCLIFEEDLPAIRAELQKVFAGANSFGYDYRARCKDGGYLWLRLRGVVTERRGDTAIANVVKLDITEQVEAAEQIKRKERETRHALTRMGRMVCFFDIAGRTLTLPKEYAKKHGLPAVMTDVPQSFVEQRLVEDQDAKAFGRFFEAILRGEKRRSVKAHIRCADGTWAWERADAITILDAEGKPARAVITMEDITESVLQLDTMTERITTEMRRAEEYQQLFIDAATEMYAGITKIDLGTGNASRIEFRDGVPVELDTGRKWEQYFADILSSIHPDDRAMVAKKAHRGSLDGIPAGKRVSFTYRSDIRGQGYRWYTTTLRVSDGLRGNRKGADAQTAECEPQRFATAFTVDISDQMLERERLKDLSEHDGLTDLFNRVKYEEMVKTEYQELTSCGVLFFDVNNLKQMNDTKGHEVGNALLRQVAESVRSITNRRVHAYRYGGDEFVVVACDAQEKELDHLLNMWQTRLHTLERESGLKSPVAAGKAWSKAPLSVDELINAADKAMYINKQEMKK